jgi:hypothetical protein
VADAAEALVLDHEQILLQLEDMHRHDTRWQRCLLFGRVTFLIEAFCRALGKLEHATAFQLRQNKPPRNNNNVHHAGAPALSRETDVNDQGNACGYFCLFCRCNYQAVCLTFDSKTSTMSRQYFAWGNCGMNNILVVHIPQTPINPDKQISQIDYHKLHMK